VTPAEEPGSRSRDPAVARLLRWYPRAWRERYGEEFLAMVEDGLDGQRLGWRLRVSVAGAGLRERGRFSGRTPRLAVTTRIVLALLAFTAAVLVGAVVPLTLNATGHDRDSFVQATAGMAVTDAAIAQAHLDGLPDSPLLNLFRQTWQQGNGLLIVNGKDVPLHNDGMPPGNWAPLIRQVDQEIPVDTGALEPARGAMTEITGSWVIAALPVYQRGGPGPVVGTVVLARPTKSLNSEIIGLWILLGTISVLAMIAAALLAFGLARWVSRPLKGSAPRHAG
jgi:hypothetical protein